LCCNAWEETWFGKISFSGGLKIKAVADKVTD
jgi:hypothetical protein